MTKPGVEVVAADVPGPLGGRRVGQVRVEGDADQRGPVMCWCPSPDVLSLKQCAAVSITVGDSSVPEHAKTRLSS